MKMLLVGSGLTASRFTPPALNVLHDVLRETGLRESDAPIVSPEAARFTIMKQSPNVVVAMGDDAARAVIPNWELSATKARGYLFHGHETSHGPAKVLVTVHPEQARKSWVPFRVLLNYDFQRAKDESRSNLLHRPERHVSVVSSSADAERAVAALSRASRLACDIEIFDDQRIRCVGFAPDPRHAIVFPDRYFDAAARVLTNGVPKIFQNGHGFDAYYLLSRCGVRVENYADDVMIAWHCLPGGQKVDTLEGPIAIKDLVGREDVWVWGWKDGAPHPAKMKKAWMTRRNAPLVRVKLLKKGKPGSTRNSPSTTSDYDVQEIVCTPDHRFLMLDGTYKEAKDLQTGDGLTHLSISGKHRGRRHINVGGRRIPAARYVWETLCGDIPPAHHVHHKNENPADDRPENLECLFGDEHKKIHAPKDSPNARSWRKRKVDPTEVVKYYQAGLSMREVCQRFEIDFYTLRKMLAKAGTPTRSKSASQTLRHAKRRNARVLAVEQVAAPEDVYCLEAPATGNFSVNGIIVHNSCYPELAGTQTDNEGNRKGVKRTHKSLHFFASLFTLDEWWKNYEFQNEHECYVLNGKDCCITFDAYLALEKMIERQGVRKIYEHMMRQVWPVVTITARGLRVDESLRRERLVALEERIGVTAARLNEIVVPLLERERDRIDLKLFEQIDGVCKCCRHASKKQLACWSCAGFEKAPTKKMLREAGVALGVCRECEGAPRREWLSFNPNSSAQKCVLLYDILKLPKRMKDGSLSADEDSLKGLLQYVA